MLITICALRRYDNVSHIFYNRPINSGKHTVQITEFVLSKVLIPYESELRKSLQYIYNTLLIFSLDMSDNNIIIIIIIMYKSFDAVQILRLCEWSNILLPISIPMFK